MPPPCMLPVIVLAAFWATENMDEKNPAEFGGCDWPFSGVGESGASVMLESLLGTMLAAADPDCDLRCTFTALGEEEEGDAPSPGAEGSEMTGGSFLSRCAAGIVRSTGVGGVLTMTGPYLSLLVEGRGSVVRREGEWIECFSGEAVILAAAGSSGRGAISLTASLDALGEGDGLLDVPRRRRRERRDGRRSRGSKSVTCKAGVEVEPRTDVVVARLSGGREMLLIRC